MMPETTKVLIADDHQVIREGIRHILGKRPQYELVGEASNGREAVDLVDSLRPDIVVMDLRMPQLNGLEATLEMKQSYPEVQIVIFTMFCDSSVVSLFRAGISGYVMKDEPLSDLLVALDAVKLGGTYLSRAVQRVLQRGMRKMDQEEDNPFEKLSTRERQVFTLLADGMSVKATAAKLCISPKTVESHKYNIMEKLHVSSVADLTKKAIEEGVIKV
jgi:DNA-binding NarL/FixJ family response regulator